MKANSRQSARRPDAQKVTSSRMQLLSQSEKRWRNDLALKQREAR